LLDEGRSHAPDGRRPLPPRVGETEGLSLKGRGCETLLGMKGWRPSACQGSKPDRPLLKRTQVLPERRIDRPVFIQVLGLLIRGQGSPFSRSEAPQPSSRTDTAPERPRSKTAPVLHLLQETVRPGNEDQRTDTQTRGERAISTRAWPPLGPEARQSEKSTLGVGVTP
jgi:hypothetical protein